MLTVEIHDKICYNDLYFEIYILFLLTLRIELL